MGRFGSVYLVFDALRTVAPAEVAAGAARLGVKFPAGYAEYLAELGKGMYSDFLQLWEPREIEKDLPEFRRFLSENLASDNFFWDKDGPLTPQRTVETVNLGHTFNGDNLVFHPDRPDELFFLPRHDDQIYRAGSGLVEALDWLCESGVLTRPTRLRYFEPEGERARIERAIPLPYMRVRDALVNLGVHDHIAYEERPEDQEKVFDVFVKGEDGDYEEVEDEGDAAIKLLIHDIGGDVVAMNGSLFDPDSTDVTIDYVKALTPHPRLDRLRRLLDELESGGGKSKGKGKPRKR